MPHSSSRTRYEESGDQVEEPLRALSKAPDTPPPRAIPIRAVLRPLLASWPILVVGLLMGPAIAYVMQSRTPITYSAEALVAPNRTRTDVQFVPQIKTVSDTTTQPSMMSAERRQALVDLVRSSNVEARVAAGLNGKLESEDLGRGALIQHVSGAIRPRSEILSIQAVAATPSDAVQIVNSWARNYVDEVNRLYSSPDPDKSIQALRDQAQNDLDAAQAELTSSIASSQLEALSQQINQLQSLLTLLQSPYQAAVPADSKSSNSTNSDSSAPPSLNDYRLAERRALDDLAQTLRRVDATRQNVRALVLQAQTNGAGGASDAAALALLKTQLVAISDGLPSQLQLQVPSSTSGGSADELQALANSLDGVRTQLADEFATRRAAYEERSKQQVASLEQELQDLRAKREAADAERKRLTAARDLASDTYTALAKKAQEQRVAASTVGHEVEMASEATFASPLPRQNSATTIEFALIGLLIAAAIAYIRWYWLGSGRSLDAVPLWPRSQPDPEHSGTS